MRNSKDLLPRSLLKYRGMSRCVDFWAVQGATREHTRNGSVTEEQRSTAQKAAQPSGRGHLGPSGGVAPARPPSSPRSPLPPPRSLQPHEGAARRSRLAIWPKLASRDIPQYFNRLLRRVAAPAKLAEDMLPMPANVLVARKLAHDAEQVADD